MGVLNDVVSVLQDNLFVMEKNEKIGYVDSRKQSVIEHIEELKKKMEEEK